MTRSPLWKLPVALLAALALLLAACGDDDDTATETTGEADGADDTGGSEDTDGGSDDQDLEGADLGECGFFVEFADSFDDVDPSEMFAAGEEIDFGSFFGPIAAQFDSVADAAPSEIQDAFRTVADDFAEVADALDGVVIDLSNPQEMDPEAVEALETMESSFDTPEFDAASAEIDAWMQDNCPDLANAVELDTFGSG